MLSFLKLIRIQNLLIIAFTQYMVRWCIIYPILRAQNLNLVLSNFHFFLLSLSTVMIAAAGYTINDYFDIKMDRINKPDKMVVGKAIKRRVAMGAHTVINVIAILIALYVSWYIGMWKLSIIFFVCAMGLWYYSTNLKKQFLTGNLLIAAFTAMVPVIVGIFDLLSTKIYYSAIYSNLSFKFVWYHILVIAFFAFITTLVREIIKDIEDYEGDKEYGSKTVPIVIGKTASKSIIILLILFTMTCLAYFQIVYQWQRDWLSFYYFIFALQLPFAFLIYKLVVADTPKKLRFAGNLTKGIMLTGICYLFIFAYLQLQYINAL